MTEFNQGDLLELEIIDLSNSGEGVARYQGRVIFIPDTVTGDRALVRLVQVKSKYSYGKLHQLLQPSPHRLTPRCIVADKCGGCQWQHITDHYQQVSKENQVIQALQRIGGFSKIPLAPILPSFTPLGYRNKASYPLAVSPTGNIKAGYYRRGTHKLINLNQCPLQDSRLNPFLAEIKQDIQQQGWSIYQEENHQGFLRHLALRIGRRTGEVLLTLVSTTKELPGIEKQAKIWLKRYPHLVGVCLNYHPSQGNAIFGDETITIAGLGYLKEIFAGLEFRLCPDTFFQVNTETAEALLNIILEKLNLTGNEILVDAYSGIGTFTLPLAKRVKQAIAIELQPASVNQAKLNAEINQLNNIRFFSGTVEEILPQIEDKPDLVILDPPRKGCDRQVLDTLLKVKPSQIVYISCQPPSLARDLKLLCENRIYQLSLVQPADFFPQTSHVECVAFLEKT